MTFDALVIAAHADDAETLMGGTLAKLADRGQRILLVDVTDGEPTEFASPGKRAAQALEAARILRVDRWVGKPATHRRACSSTLLVGTGQLVDGVRLPAGPRCTRFELDDSRVHPDSAHG
jgi:LmbE family N-acetylglucosaminyl deacetylase